MSQTIKLSISESRNQVGLTVAQRRDAVPLSMEQVRIIRENIKEVYADTTEAWNNQLTMVPKRGDIITLNHEGQTYLKRIIGIEGDKVSFENGSVVINGMRVNELYLPKDTVTEGEEEYLVPKGAYFCLGDNRSESEDSRRWEKPFVERRDILGQVMLKAGF